MNTIESFFDELTEMYQPEEPKTQGDKVIMQVEKEFRGFSEEQKSRQKEIKYIRNEMKKLKRKFRRYKNIKNSRKVEVNTLRSKKRAEIRKKIELLNLRLEEIKLEG